MRTLRSAQLLLRADKACARPTEPKPAPTVRNKSRLLKPNVSKVSRFIFSVHHLKFVGSK